MAEKGRPKQKARKAAAKPKAGRPRPKGKSAPRMPSRRRTSSKAEPVPRGKRAEALRGALPAERVASLGEEERIESSKYELPEAKHRVFEEERFLFPESYETDRVRLLVKDPEWLFAHWDVSKGSLRRLRDDVGERAMALSRLTLKVDDPADGALSVVLLPEAARSWYVRTRLDHRAYRAQLGLTMPSGEFRALATSNVVVTPRLGPAPERASRRVPYARAHEAASVAQVSGASSPLAAQAPSAEASTGSATVAYIDGGAAEPEPVSSLPDQGGASDVYKPGGASDLYRR